MGNSILILFENRYWGLARGKAMYKETARTVLALLPLTRAAGSPHPTMLKKKWTQNKNICYKMQVYHKEMTEQEKKPNIG